MPGSHSGLTPDELAIPVNLPDTVKGNSLDLAGFIGQFERAAFSRRKSDLLQGDTVDRAFLPIENANLEPGSAEFLVPPDSVQQFMDRRHGSTIEPSSWSAEARKHAPPGFSKPRRYCTPVPPGRMPRLYGSQDGRRYSGANNLEMYRKAINASGRDSAGCQPQPCGHHGRRTRQGWPRAPGRLRRTRPAAWSFGSHRRRRRPTR